MNKYWNIKNYNLELEGKIMLANFSLSLNSNSMVCFLGESGSGKSLLLKKLLSSQDQWETNGSTAFYLGEVKNIKSWKDEFSYDQLNLEWQTFLTKFLMNQENLSIRCAIISKIIKRPDFFFCEDLHHYLKTEEMDLLWNFCREMGIKVFYVTNCIEDTPFFDYLMVIKNNQIAMEGKTSLVLQEEKLMKLLGFSLPFYVNLSIQLKYYGLVDKLCLTKEELEETLWPLK